MIVQKTKQQILETTQCRLTLSIWIVSHLRADTALYTTLVLIIFRAFFHAFISSAEGAFAF